MSDDATLTRFPNGFLWGAASSAHQTEGNNVSSDWWRMEHERGIERSGDAVDSYHRYREDMALLAAAGLNAYRFSIEWARIEPAPGEFSAAQLAHYRRMIETAVEFGLTPVVTLHHFTHPLWFVKQGGWHAEGAVDRFAAIPRALAPILDGVDWLCTINEPNILALFESGRRRMGSGGVPVAQSMVTPDMELGRILADAHHAATSVLRDTSDANIGWAVAMQSFVATPGNEAVHAELRHEWENFYLEAAKDDDYIGVQSYTSQDVDEHGVVPHPDHPDNMLTGWAFRPDALGIAVRQAWDAGGGVPLFVTENGVAIRDDACRIDYTSAALRHLGDAMADGVDVRGYLHWSAHDSFEWGTWTPTFGLIEVDRATFVRTPKPSLAWLGDVAKRNCL